MGFLFRKSIKLLPGVRINPAAKGRLEYVPELSDDRPYSQEGEVITRPFLVDSVSKAEFSCGLSRS